MEFPWRLAEIAHLWAQLDQRKVKQKLETVFLVKTYLHQGSIKFSWPNNNECILSACIYPLVLAFYRCFAATPS